MREDCVCSFDFIVDIPRFIQYRVDAVVKHHKSQICTVQKTVILVNQIMENLPACYTTRSGCEVEDHPLQEHSDHDASRLMGVLLVTELNEIVVNLCSGAHRSAVRTMRSLLEWMLRTVAAVSDRRIFTENSRDANRAVCFEGLRIAIQYGEARGKMNKEERRLDAELLKTARRDDKAAHFLDFVTSARISDGVGTIPKRLNDKIMYSINQNHKTQGNMEGTNPLYCIYNQLSQHVHNTISKLDDMQYGGLTEFHDSEYFNESCLMICRAVDVVLYLYFILLDIDIFHQLDDKRRYREYAKKKFCENFAERELIICRTLFESKVWDDPVMEFTYPRENRS